MRTQLRLYIPTRLSMALSQLGQKIAPKVIVGDILPQDERLCELHGTFIEVQQSLTPLMVALEESCGGLQDSVSVKLPVARNQMGAIIGKGGTVISNLREQAKGCRNFPQKNTKSRQNL